MIPVLIAGAAAAAVSAKYALDSVNPMVPTSSARPASTAFAAQVQRYADSPHEWKPLADKPADTHLVAIVPAQQVLLEGTSVQYWYTSKTSLLAALSALRSLLSAVDRGDEDPRAVMCRLAIESGWGRHCQNFAWGNIKKRPWTTRDMILRDKQVFTDTAESNGVHLLTDTGRSFDSYSSFSDTKQFLRYQARFLDQHYGTIPTIRGARDGYRLGGLEGTIASERRLQWGAGSSNEPYAGSDLIPRAVRVAAAERQAQSYWRLCVAKATTAEWTR